MPNRTLKESICTSESLALVSAEAERLFYHLLVKCDDYGRFHGNPKVIRAECFPLRIDEFAVDVVKAWLEELVTAGMVRLYCTDKRRYIEVTSWREHNTPRANKSKYPSPDDCAGMILQTSANICKHTVTNAVVHDIEHEVVSEHDIEVDGTAPSGAPTSTECPDMTPLEDELRNLKGWAKFTMDDRAWLEELVKDYPSALPVDVRDCRDYWMAKNKPHTRAAWKSRFRNWLKHKQEGFGGGNGANQQGNKSRGQPGNQPSGAFDDVR